MRLLCNARGSPGLYLQNQRPSDPLTFDRVLALVHEGGLLGPLGLSVLDEVGLLGVRKGVVHFDRKGVGEKARYEREAIGEVMDHVLPRDCCMIDHMDKGSPA